MKFATIIYKNDGNFYYFFIYFLKKSIDNKTSICYYHIVNRTKQNKEVKTMEYDIIWNEEEETELEALNDIFGL